MTKRKASAKVKSPDVPGVEWASQATLANVPWLWPRCIPAHTLTMIEGRKCTGKSTLLAAIAASITGGPVIPGWTGPRDGRIIWCGSEESWEAVTAPRLLRAGADLGKVGRFALVDSDGRKRRLLLPDHFEEMRGIIASGNIRLLVLDPYVSLISPAVDTRMEQGIRSVLEPLLDMAWELECTMLLVRHLRKGRAGDAREAGLGGAGLTNVCRALLRIDEHPHLPCHSILSPVVVSAAGRPLPGQVFKLDYAGAGPPLVWIGATDLDAQTVAEGTGDAVERGETRDAEQLLIELLHDKWVRMTAISTEALDAGISLRTLRRAKERLLVESRRVSYGDGAYWEWGAPANGWPTSVSHLVTASKSAHARRGALNDAKPKSKRKHRVSSIGAKAPPPRAHAQGALPVEGGQG